jgi:hypothetical protein
MEAEKMAQKFHEAYERLAPQFGYQTRTESAVPWEEVPEQNRKLMTAVCAEVMVPYLEVIRLFVEGTATSSGDGIALANAEARKLGL